MKKKFYFLAMMCFGFYLVQAQSYCTDYLSYYGCDYYALDNFQLSTIDQAGTGCTGGIGIADYTDVLCTLAQGEPYAFSYTSTSDPYYSFNDQLAIWIDFNDDFVFNDADEFIYSSSSGGTHSGMISIPPMAAPGNHRMRVRFMNDYNSFTATQACYTFYNYGETHDYTASIVLPPPCPSIQTVSVNNIGIHTADINWSCDDCSGPFILEYGLQGFTPGTGSDAGTAGSIVNVEDMSALPVTITDLASSTDYQVYVRRNCSADGFSSNYGPVNFLTNYDACTTLTPITCGTAVTADIPEGHGAFDATNCGNNTGKELLYSFTPILSGIYTLTITSPSYSASYYIKDASLGCDADNWNCAHIDPWTLNFGYPCTIILDTLLAGITYYVCVDAVNETYGASHTFQIDCYAPFNPCDNITAIECGVPQQATIPAGLGVFSDYNNNYSFNLGKEKLYSFTPDLTGIYSMTVSPSSNYYPGYFSYKKASEGCNDNGWHFIMSAGSNWQSYTQLIGTLVAGIDYYFMLDAGSLEGADVNFQIDCYEPFNPCNSVETISCGTSVDVNIPPGAGMFVLPACPNTNSNQLYIGKEAIFQFTPQTSGHSVLQIQWNPSNWDNYLYYYIKPASEGCSSTGWHCIARGYSGSFSIPIGLNAGEPYYIMADAMQLNGNTQSFEITCPEQWDPCSSITPITCSTSVTACIPAGVGCTDSIASNNYYYSLGKELIYSFTAELSGNYAVNITSTDYKYVKYLFKDAASGCSLDGWQSLSATAWPTTWQPLYLPNLLIAGHTYYLMLDAIETTGTTHTFELLCTDPADPCTDITPIFCGTDISVVNDHGLGVFNPSVPDYSGFYGKETVFEFTPAISGNYLLQITSSADYNRPNYFIKQASDGCNNDNWHHIITNYYSAPAGIPIDLQAGVPYYIMADGYTAGQTFQIICPDETYDYCSTLETIPGCGTSISFEIPAGLGAIGISNSCNNIATAGKEKLFDFTPLENGYYGFNVISATGNSISYYIKDATSGCNRTGWECLGNIDIYGGQQRTPFSLMAGHTYFILADAKDAQGSGQTFEIICPAEDPCNNIEVIDGCYNYISVAMPGGFNNYDLGGCGSNYQMQNSPVGSVKIYSFTPTIDGITKIGTNQYGNYFNCYFRFFIKPASLGCDGNNWTCCDFDLYTYRDVMAILPYTLTAGTTYYILCANAYYWESQFSFYMECPAACSQFADQDGDGYGGNEILYSCWPAYGYTYESGDCNDNSAFVNPGATEICTNQADDNCNGQTDEDCIDCDQLTVSITLSDDVNNFCNGIELTANTAAEVQSYLWSTGETSMSVLLTTINGAGTYSVTITDVNGCIATASYFYEPQDHTSSYTVLATQTLKFQQNTTVTNGGVGVVNSSGNATMKKNVSIAGPGAFLKAQNISLQAPYNIPTIIYAPAIVPLPAMHYNLTSTSGLPSVTVPDNTTTIINGNCKNVNIGTNCDVTMTGNIFGNITIGSQSIVLFTQSSIDLTGIILNAGAENANTLLKFGGETTLRCAGNIQVNTNCIVNTDHFKVLMYLGKTNGAPVSFTVGDGGNVTVNVSLYIPSGKIAIGGNPLNMTYMNGKFIAETIETQDKNVTWDWFVCSAGSEGEEKLAINNQAFTGQAINSGTDELELKVWPNPSMAEFKLSIASKRDEGVMVTVFDCYGRKVYSERGAAEREYTFGQDFITGVYYVVVVQETARSIIKIIKQQ